MGSCHLTGKKNKKVPFAYRNHLENYEKLKRDMATLNSLAEQPKFVKRLGFHIQFELQAKIKEGVMFESMMNSLWKFKNFVHISATIKQDNGK